MIKLANKKRETWFLYLTLFNGQMPVLNYKEYVQYACLCMCSTFLFECWFVFPVLLKFPGSLMRMTYVEYKMHNVLLHNSHPIIDSNGRRCVSLMILWFLRRGWENHTDFLRTRICDDDRSTRHKRRIIKKNEAARDDERAALANDPGVALIILRYHKNCWTIKFIRSTIAHSSLLARKNITCHREKYETPTLLKQRESGTEHQRT